MIHTKVALVAITQVALHKKALAGQIKPQTTRHASILHISIIYMKVFRDNYNYWHFRARRPICHSFFTFICTFISFSCHDHITALVHISQSPIPPVVGRAAWPSGDGTRAHNPAQSIARGSRCERPNYSATRHAKQDIFYAFTDHERKSIRAI